MLERSRISLHVVTCQWLHSLKMLLCEGATWWCICCCQSSLESNCRSVHPTGVGVLISRICPSDFGISLICSTQCYVIFLHISQAILISTLRNYDNIQFPIFAKRVEIISVHFAKQLRCDDIIKRVWWKIVYGRTERVSTCTLHTFTSKTFVSWVQFFLCSQVKVTLRLIKSPSPVKVVVKWSCIYVL